MKAQRSIHHSLRIAIASAIGLASGVALADWAIVDLGTLGGTYSGASAINNNNQIVGAANLAGDTVMHAFLWDSGTMIDLGSVQGMSTALAINNHGDVVGQDYVAGSQVDTQRPFLYSAGVYQDISAVGYKRTAQGINDSGQVIGTTGLSIQSFLYKNNVLQNLFPPGQWCNYAFGINNHGQVTGYLSVTTLGGGAWMYIFDTATGTYTTPIHDILPYTDTTAKAINDNGEVVGAYSDINVTNHAYLYSANTFTGLGTLGGSQSYALGLNNNGQVVGWARTATEATHAFLYTGGTMQDLNDLLPANSGWVLEQAAGINDNGIIVGRGTINGETHAFGMTDSPGC